MLTSMTASGTIGACPARTLHPCTGGAFGLHGCVLRSTAYGMIHNDIIARILEYRMCDAVLTLLEGAPIPISPEGVEAGGIDPCSPDSNSSD